MVNGLRLVVDGVRGTAFTSAFGIAACCTKARPRDSTAYQRMRMLNQHVDVEIYESICWFKLNHIKDYDYWMSINGWILSKLLNDDYWMAIEFYHNCWISIIESLWLLNGYDSAWDIWINGCLKGNAFPVGFFRQNIIRHEPSWQWWSSCRSMQLRWTRLRSNSAVWWFWIFLDGSLAKPTCPVLEKTWFVAICRDSCNISS